LNETSAQPKPGHPVLFSSVIENVFVEYINLVGAWGFPFNEYDIRLLAKGYLDEKQIEMPQLHGNMPGVDWVKNFVERHKDQISLRQATNISRQRAKVTPAIIDEFFANAEEELKNCPPENIMNYDETCLSDDPGTKTFVYKRGTKHPERIVNNNPKSNISIMFSGTASGHVFPCYVVYKATEMWSSWTSGGPPGTLYNRSKSGWFDNTCFTDWFKKVVIPYCRRQEGKKVIIGDNLSSHFSPEVLQLCRKYDIAFKCLPTNTTHIMQPLDVSYFAPLKKSWRTILLDWKRTEGRYIPALKKECFPRLLLRLMEELEVGKRGSNNLIAGTTSLLIRRLFIQCMCDTPIHVLPFCVWQVLMRVDCTHSNQAGRKNGSHIIILSTTIREPHTKLCPSV
jgi:hypothetical protein